MLLVMVILGGLGNITGVILGGLIIQFADRLFLPQLSQLVPDAGAKLEQRRAEGD